MPYSTKSRSPWWLGHLVTLVRWLYMLASLVVLLTRVVVLEDWIGTIAGPILPPVDTIDEFISNLPQHGYFAAMDCLTSIFGMRSRAYHNAIDDIMGEAVVVTAFIRFISQFDDMYEDEKSET